MQSQIWLAGQFKLVTVELARDNCAYVGFGDRAGSWYADGRKIEVEVRTRAGL